MKPILTFILFALTMGSGVEAQEWTRFRGPNGSGISKARTLPTTWTETDFNWKVPLPGIGHSSPVLWGEKIFATSFDERAGKFLVICIGTKDGRVLWQQASSFTPSSKHEFNSFASATPTVDALHVYACRVESSRVALSALDHEGNAVWERDLGAFDARHGSGSSPIVHEDLVILANEHQGEGFLLALDARTGETRWQVPRSPDAGNYSTPCVYQPDQNAPVLIFNSQAHGISAISPQSGEIVWDVPDVFTRRSVSSPVLAGDLILGSCGSGGGGNYVVAVRPGDSSHGGKAELAYEVRRSAPYVPTSLCVGDWLYLWSDAGIVSRVHAATGEVQWQERAKGRFFGSPVCVDGRLFCVSTTGEVVVVNVSDQFEVLARNALGEATHSTPAVAGGRMYIRTVGHLISVGGAAHFN